MHRRTWLVAVLLFLYVMPVSAQTGGKKRRALPYEFGRVTISTYSDRASIAPVVFEHWLHRSLFTCRVCHVDVGFAMKPPKFLQAGDVVRVEIDKLSALESGVIPEG